MLRIFLCSSKDVLLRNMFVLVTSTLQDNTKMQDIDSQCPKNRRITPTTAKVKMLALALSEPLRLLGFLDWDDWVNEIRDYWRLGKFSGSCSIHRYQHKYWYANQCRITIQIPLVWSCIWFLLCSHIDRQCRCLAENVRTQDAGQKKEESENHFVSNRRKALIIVYSWFLGMSFATKRVLRR